MWKLHEAVLTHNSLDEKQRNIEQWLTDIEVKLIKLQPFVSDLEEGQQINELQVSLSI